VEAKPNLHGTAPCSSQSVASQPSRPASLSPPSPVQEPSCTCLIKQAHAWTKAGTCLVIHPQTCLQRMTCSAARVLAAARMLRPSYSHVLLVRVRSLASRRDIYFRAAPECGSQVLRVSPHPDRKRKESHCVRPLLGAELQDIACRSGWLNHMFAVAVCDVGVPCHSPDSGFIDGLCLIES
jgi:hypothetical protein